MKSTTHNVMLHTSTGFISLFLIAIIANTSVTSIHTYTLGIWIANIQVWHTFVNTCMKRKHGIINYHCMRMNTVTYFVEMVCTCLQDNRKSCSVQYQIRTLIFLFCLWGLDVVLCDIVVLIKQALRYTHKFHH